MPFGWVGAAVAVAGAVSQASAAEDAEDAQHAATQGATAQGQESLALQQRMYDEGVARQQPFLDAGVGALEKLNGLLGINGQPGTLQNDFTFDGSNLEADPGYQFQLQQGQNAISRRQAAGGGFYSGAGLAEAAKFNQGLASTSFNDAYARQFGEFQTERANVLNPLQSLAGQGQTQANQTAASGQNFANASAGINNSLMGLTTAQGNATGASGIAQSNALVGGLNNGLAAWQRAGYMNQSQQPAYGGWSQGVGDGFSTNPQYGP